MPPHSSRCVSRITPASRLKATPSTYATAAGTITIYGYLDKRYGDGHPTSADVLAAIARHEAGLGDKADPKSRASATRRAIWSYAVRRVPGGLLENLSMVFGISALSLVALAVYAASFRR